MMEKKNLKVLQIVLLQIVLLQMVILQMVILQLLLLVLLQLLVQLLLLKVNQNSQARKIMRHNHLNLPRRIINQHHNSKALRRKEIRNRPILKRKRLNQSLMQVNYKICHSMMMEMLLE